MKKSKFIKTAALLMSSLMCLESGAAALGEVFYESSIPIGVGTSLNESVYTYSGIQNEHYIDYTPNEYVTPVVVYGSKVCNYGNFDTMAGLLEKKGWNVIGGTNGDYYVMATYQPIGIVMTEGVLHSSDGGLWAVGFRNDGTAMIGRPSIAASVTLGSTAYRVYGINKEIKTGDFYLYTDTYSYTTKNTVPTVNVVLSCPEDYQLKLNSEVELTVEEIIEADSELYMREGKFILSLTQDSDSWRMDGVNGLSVGDKVKLSVTADEAWNDIEYAVGSLYKLIENGEIISGVTDKLTSPRTAVGIRDDGSVVFFTVDGRQPGYSMGMTLPEVAERLLELGCTEACLLDGGGSTNLHAQYIGDEETSQVNRPSGENERSVTNYIMLVAKNEGSGRLTQVAVYPNEPVVLLGTKVQFEVKGADETSRPVEVSEKTRWLSAGGSITSDGEYTPEMTGTYDITAYVGEKNDTSTVTVIDTPSSISLHKDELGGAVSSLNVYTGTSETLIAKAKYNNISVMSSANAYRWEVVGNIGTIDQNGVFTAGEQQGSGKIIVTAGDCSTAIDVTVGAEIKEIQSFENYETAAEGLSVETAKDNVRFGNSSLRLDYSLGEAGRFETELPISLDKKFRYISLWVCGNGSGARLGARMSDGSETELGIIDFSGWKQLIVPASSGITVEAVFIEGSGEGSIWLDQICASTTVEADAVQPDIAITESEGHINVVVGDNIDAVIPVENISISYDGVPIEFSYEPNSGTAQAFVEPVDGYHRISVTARDQSGNLSTNSVTVVLNAPAAPFEDVYDHWAEEYVSYMYSQNVVDGVEDTLFAPDASVTRAQCALMICRWLGIDTSLYADTELDFVDSADIPAYALDAVKAMYSLGIITGIDTKTGVYYAPNSALTREQAMTIVGRIQQSGYPLADIAAYSDAAKVQSWSEKYVKELVGRGIISGFEDGTLRPAAAVTRAQLVKILTEVR
ncbi:MAG: S-layer homology domain-containing protein [Clostridiales bacterium]|nr:S-layer homology domain-containing protein [Clostridiales bacterium]